MLKQSADKRRIEKNDKPFFYLADTVWSAFTNIDLTDWAYYLKVRKEQGLMYCKSIFCHNGIEVY